MTIPGSIADPTRRVWAPALDAGRAAEARSVGLEVAARVTDRARLDQALQAAPRQSQFPDIMHWQPCGTAQGDAGLALFCERASTARRARRTRVAAGA